MIIGCAIAAVLTALAFLGLSGNAAGRVASWIVEPLSRWCWSGSAV
ncbi:hypothetical protein [Nocardia arthritidis]|uniref:Uncharacterized protein n=1 Tax=Nocardia arthritidis TaxID=228602 RepID=A0A6G9Y979_9NOCA|nr:hypothetical protein [Nocardia arthritidis]QIS09771.1 hypothetical protein F5544_09355 [Nocardia arthritidis]